MTWGSHWFCIYDPDFGDWDFLVLSPGQRWWGYKKTGFSEQASRPRDQEFLIFTFVERVWECWSPLCCWQSWDEKQVNRDFLSDPGVNTLLSNARSAISILIWELRSHMPHGQKNQNVRQKQYCNKFNKDFKNGPHQEKTFFLKKGDKQHTLL